MQIKNIEVFHANGGWRPWTFVKISTSEGITGWSECTDSHGSPKGVEGVINDLSRLLIDKDPREINKILFLLHSRTRQSPGSIIHKAIAGIENALWDILAKTMNCPVNSLFGGKLRDKIDLYWSHCGTSRVRAHNLISKPKISKIDDLESFAKEIKDSGYKAIKTNIARFSNDPHIYMPGFAKSDGFPELNINFSLENDIVLWISSLRKFLGETLRKGNSYNLNLPMMSICYSYLKDLIN